ncbi:MAG: rod shape-determining protein MreC [Candidatus Portnoybacteria bacterium]|nr:rod shape-determining protein MreC [Candidatus Portnoybacteria bacterium]
MAKNNSRKFYILGGIVAATALLVFFNFSGWFSAPKDFVCRICFSVSRPFYSLGLKISGIFHFVGNFKDLAYENEQLKEENRQLTLKFVELREVLNENDFLSKQLQMLPPLKSRLIMADIVGFNSDNLGQLLMLNRGANEGLAENQAAIFAGGLLVGRLIKVNKNSSQVLAITDSKSSVLAVTQESRLSGVIKGDHSAGLIFEVASLKEGINEGELLITSGLDGNFPRGLLIGRIESKISQESEALHRFKVKPALNCKQLERVFVVIGNN